MFLWRALQPTTTARVLGGLLRRPAEPAPAAAEPQPAVAPEAPAPPARQGG